MLVVLILVKYFMEEGIIDNLVIVVFDYVGVNWVCWFVELIGGVLIVIVDKWMESNCEVCYE